MLFLIPPPPACSTHACPCPPTPASPAPAGPVIKICVIVLCCLVFNKYMCPPLIEIKYEAICV